MPAITARIPSPWITPERITERPNSGASSLRGFERGRIVDRVTGHCHYFAVGFQSADDTQLLFWHCARKNAGGLDAPAQFVIAYRVQLRAGDDFTQWLQSNLKRDIARRARVIAGDHDDTNTRVITFFHRTRHSNGLAEIARTL